MMPTDGHRRVHEPTPVERFVRDVLPSVPGGPFLATESPGHTRLMRRAAKNRGLSIRNVAGDVYLYAGHRPVGGVRKTMSTLNSPEAIAICRSKDLAKQMLDAAGLPTPAGIIVGSDQFDDAAEHLESMDGPAVLKPMSQARGEGVTCWITTEDELKAAWDTAQAAARRAPGLLLDEQIDGIDVRVHVIGRRPIAVITRLPSHVVGDGRLSVRELIVQKQQQRDQHAYLAKTPLTVDPAVLARSGRALDDVPGDGEVVVLYGPANVQHGGDPVDVTELVHPDLLRLAVDAARAIPGLRNAGVDLMARDLDTVDGAVVLETNFCPDIRIHHHPSHGRPRDVAGAIVDEMITVAGVRVAPQRAGAARRMARAVRRRVRR
jgi:cyanophycin synthetase